MFIAYAIPIGLLVGALAGGRLDGLARLRIHWAPLAIAGLLVQVLLFNGPLGELAGDAAPAIYVGSTAAVLVTVFANLGLPGLPLVALGAISNLAAIVANGGYMPADPGAVEAAGLGAIDGVSNSVELVDPALAPLTDVFALPAWLPFANVFSIGDVLIGVGVVWAIAAAMRSAPSMAGGPPATDAAAAGSRNGPTGRTAS